MTAPSMIFVPQVRAPKACWAASPPAPWHTGMPPVRGAARLKRPMLSESFLSVIPPSGQYERARAAVAITALAAVSGSWANPACTMTSQIRSKAMCGADGSLKTGCRLERHVVFQPHDACSQRQQHQRGRDMAAAPERDDNQDRQDCQNPLVLHQLKRLVAEQQTQRGLNAVDDRGGRAAAERGHGARQAQDRPDNAGGDSAGIAASPASTERQWRQPR